MPKNGLHWTGGTQRPLILLWGVVIGFGDLGYSLDEKINLKKTYSNFMFMNAQPQHPF